MKLIFVIGILLLCGCIGVSFVSADSLEYPDLTGNWSGMASGYYAPHHGYFNETSGLKYLLSVVEQHGPVCNGTISIKTEDFNSSYIFSGIISSDLKTLYLVEEGTGMDFARLVSPDGMEFIGLDPKTGGSLVINFTRET